MKESRKEFIKKAHDAACSTWKPLIEKEFPKLFKKDFKVGDWVVGTGLNLSHIGRIATINKKKYTYIGFNVVNDWIENDYYLFDDAKPIKANKNQVQEALIKEAKKRGFKAGDKIKKLLGINVGSLDVGCDKEIENKPFSYDFKSDNMFVGNLMIYSKGEWAEIIPNKKEMTVKQLEKELGYEIKIVK